MKYLIIFSCLFYVQSTSAQGIIRGKVINGDTKEPLPSISVYLNSTSLGTITDKQGIFILRGIPAGKFRLVASGIGFETYIKLVDPKQAGGEFVISLKPKPEELKSFDVLPPDPDGMKKWGPLFIKIFIGTSHNSDECHIENPEIIKFRLNSDNTLSVYASEPLKIMNYALGYEIIYKLEEFEYNFSSKLVVYNGYALFKDLSLTSPKKADQWKENRKATYEGSLLHFMRTFFINKLEARGFEMRSLGLISNPAKDSAKEIFRQHPDSVILDTTFHEIIPTDPGFFQEKTLARNVTDRYKAALLEPDSVISHRLVVADSIGFMADSSTAGLYFPDSLEVSYTHKSIPNQYKRISKSHRNESYPVSQFVFINRKPIFVLSNGYYFGPYDLKITGFRAWWETMANMLPYDFLPASKH